MDGPGQDLFMACGVRGYGFIGDEEEHFLEVGLTNSTNILHTDPISFILPGESNDPSSLN